MKTKNMILMGAALVAVLAVTGFKMEAGSFVACAQQGPGGHQPPPPGQRGPGGPGGDRVFERLNLTDAQKQQIKALRDKSRTDAESFHEQLSGIGEQMHTIVEASTFDEAAARALLAKEAQIETELKLIRIRTDNAIHNLLTTEQKAKLDELRRNPGRPRHGN